MTFPDALAAIFNDNARVQRGPWSKSIFVGLENAILCIKGFSHSGLDDGKWHPWTITESDYFADDWEVVE